MFSNRLGPILFASVMLGSLAFILQGSNKAEAKIRVTEVVPSEGEVPASQTNIPAPPFPDGITSRISAEQAQQHIGQPSTVCGLVAGGRYLEASSRKPTLLNFSRPYPDHTFSVMIPDSDRPKFKQPPEVLFNGKTVCVTGVIIEFRGKPQIVVENPSQIVIAAAAQATANKTATNAVEKTPTTPSAP